MLQNSQNICEVIAGKTGLCYTVYGGALQEHPNYYIRQKGVITWDF